MRSDRRGAPPPLILVLAAAVTAAVVAAGVRARGRVRGTVSRLRPGGRGRASKAETFTCECGQAYRVSGLGRHRVYWPEGAGERDALMTPQCVSCERALPAT
jgi:hypothetical protein